MRYQLQKQQQLNCDLETAWSFFAAASNLSKITPKEMNFTVLNELQDEHIFEGMIIDYLVTPLLGIQMKWQTEITQVDFQKSFTDFQKKGPYKYWNHFHGFIPNEKGVLVKDSVDYELPYGFLGEMMHNLIVKNKLNKIFDYRYEILESKFNQTQTEL